METTLIKFIEGFVGQIIWYALWTLPAFIIFWVLFKKYFSKRRIQQKQVAKKTQFFSEIKNSLITMVVFAAVDLFVFHDSTSYIQTPIFKVYTNINEHGGLLYMLLTTLALFVVEDTYFYWMHRTIHSPKLYKYVHKVHHESIDTSPFTSYSFHPIEAALEIVPLGLILIYAYFFPVHAGALVIWQIGSIALNVLGHSGYELFPSFWNKYWFLKWKLPSTHHNMHHERFNGNYGLYFIWWDRIMGTEFADYEEKFASIFTKPGSEDAVIYHPLKIASIKNENDEAYSICFENFPYAFRNYKAGQHVTIKIEIDNEFYYRTFSLSSSPVTDKYLRLTIRKINDGLVTNYMINHLKNDDYLSVGVPKGNFFIEPNPVKERKIFLFAAGSGITPLYSMLRTILHDEPNSKLFLFYANRNNSSSIFLNELNILADNNRSRFFLLTHFSEVDGQATKNQIAALSNFRLADEYYLCGPAGFMDMVKSSLTELGVEKSKIKSEAFTTAYSGHTNLVVADKVVAAVKLSYNSNEYDFNVFENEVILDAAIRQNIKIPFSCRSGMCGTCVANCTSGMVKMNESQLFLSQAEIDNAKVLLCQSHPQSKNLTIKIK
jgi:ring-1,2-phenylacetyl-CoA epoxidase subunit PaaE